MGIKKIGIRFYNLVYRIFSGSGLYKIPFVRKVNKKVLSLIRQKSVSVHGVKLYLDSRDSLNLSINPKYEPEETRFLSESIRPGQCVIDIGANIGYYTTLMAKLVGPDGKVFAFEPDPDNFETLKKNIEVNGFRNVTIEKLAISDVTKDLKLFYSTDKGDQRVYDSNDGRQFRTIKAVSLDDYLTDFRQPVHFIKMDIQGAEGYALQGMRKTITGNNLLMNIEFWPLGLDNSGFGARKFIETLKDMNVHYRDSAEEGITDQNAEKLFEKYTPAKKNFTNLICRHSV